MATGQPYEEFLNLYANLRGAFSDDPHNLIRWQQAGLEQDRVAQEIYDLTRNAGLQKTFGGKRKIVDYVPAGFRESWSDYLKRWSCFVDYYVDRKRGVVEFFPLSPEEYSDELLPRGETRFSFRPRSPDPAEESEFDPSIHHGHGIWEMVENFLGERAAVDPEVADESSSRFSIAYDYLYFLRTDLRLDLEGMERRWRMVPLFLRPRHVVEHDLATRLSLYGNLENAVTAFIFGATKAALALCRATLEMVLRDFYTPKPVPKNLKEVVKSACREHELIRLNKDRIFRFKCMADKALHRADTDNGAEMVKRERDVAQFMEVLAILIQGAPHRPAGSET